MDASPSTSSIDGVLDVALHHARDIHNICIYGNQDVYAKFSITHTQEAVYPTQPIRAGGKNPVFNQSLKIPISTLDSVLKCEIWMLSAFRTYLQDQLLGFVLVPLSALYGQGRVTKDYPLSSTDLFHTPAGIVCLSLTFNLQGSEFPVRVDAPMSSIHGFNRTHGILSKSTDNAKSEDAHIMTTTVNPSLSAADYSNIEFPDLQSVSEDQRLVSLYLKMASSETNIDEHAHSKNSQTNTFLSTRDVSSVASFLQLGSSAITDCDYEMGTESREEASYQFQDGYGSPLKEVTLSLTMPVSRSEATMSMATLQTKEVHSLDSKPTLSMDVSTHFTQESDSPQVSLSLTSPTSAGSTVDMSNVKVVAKSSGQAAHSDFDSSVVSISLQPEEPVVQQQIVDMYMKSMQQFTESLARVKLPVDLESARVLKEINSEIGVKKKDPTSESSTKDGNRVFYGSRAFF